MTRRNPSPCNTPTPHPATPHTAGRMRSKLLSRRAMRLDWPCCWTWSTIITGQVIWTCGISMGLRAPTRKVAAAFIFSRPRLTLTFKSRLMGRRGQTLTASRLTTTFQNNIVMWLSEYHVDGFRWDDPYTLTHDNAGNYISNAGNLLNGINNMTHANYPGKISMPRTSLIPGDSTAPGTPAIPAISRRCWQPRRIPVAT